MPLPDGEPTDWSRVVAAGHATWDIGFTVEEFEETLRAYETTIEEAGYIVNDDTDHVADLAARNGDHILTVFGSGTHFGLGITPNL